jgi:hypothetical protein
MNNSCATANRRLKSRASLLKIEMMMLAAPRIEHRAARRAPRFALQILANGQLRPASPAQNRPLAPFAPWPHCNHVSRQLNVTILAGVVHPAALHLDCDKCPLPSGSARTASASRDRYRAHVYRVQRSGSSPQNGSDATRAPDQSVIPTEQRASFASRMPLRDEGPAFSFWSRSFSSP